MLQEINDHFVTLGKIVMGERGRESFRKNSKSKVADHNSLNHRIVWVTLPDIDLHIKVLNLLII